MRRNHPAVHRQVRGEHLKWRQHHKICRKGKKGKGFFFSFKRLFIVTQKRVVNVDDLGPLEKYVKMQKIRERVWSRHDNVAGRKKGAMQRNKNLVVCAVGRGHVRGILKGCPLSSLWRRVWAAHGEILGYITDFRLSGYSGWTGLQQMMWPICRKRKKKHFQLKGLVSPTWPLQAAQLSLHLMLE